jgi:hypothetical protein
MPSLLFRCPYTRSAIQSWMDEETTAGDVYVSIECPICTRMHLVNPKTGRVLGAMDESED